MTSPPRRSAQVQPLRHAAAAAGLGADAILASMSDAILVVDAGGRLVRVNHAARQLLCVDETSVVLGQPLDSEQWGQWPLGARAVAETLAPLIDVLLQP